MSRVDTVLPADSAEFCPTAHATQIFVVGTYQLEDLPLPDGQSNDGSVSDRQVRRRGGCLVYEANESSDQWCLFALVRDFIHDIYGEIVLYFRTYRCLLCWT